MLRKYAFSPTSCIVFRRPRTYLRLSTPSCTAMSLLQDVLRHQTLDSMERRFDVIHEDSDNSDDELVNVVGFPGSLYAILD